MGIPFFFNRGGAPNPPFFFSLQKKKAKRLAPEPPSAGQTYFEPGVLQLPTVKQIKRLYNSVQNRFYKQVQKGAFNGTQQQQRHTAKRQRQNDKNKRKKHKKSIKYTLFNWLARWEKYKNN